MVINKNNNNPAPNNASEETSTHSQTGAGFYSDEQIQKHISQIPTPNMILLQKLDDERIKQQIRNAFPKANEDSVSRAFTMIKAQNLNS